MMPTRVNPSRSRNGASNRVACGCAVGTLLLSSLLVVLVLSSASVPANQARNHFRSRTLLFLRERCLFCIHSRALFLLFSYRHIRSYLHHGGLDNYTYSLAKLLN